MSKRYVEARRLLDDENPNEEVACSIWTAQDVLDRAKENGTKCSRKRAIEIIKEIDHRMDAEEGINWGVIDCYLSE